jgi:hypothetical protein
MSSIQWYRNQIFVRFFSGKLRIAKQDCTKLVAEACADGDLVTALGATAAQNGCTSLGLHTGKEAVGLCPVAAVWLKGTLRHDKKLLRRATTPAQTFRLLQQSLSIPYGTGFSQFIPSW